MVCKSLVRHRQSIALANHMLAFIIERSWWLASQWSFCQLPTSIYNGKQICLTETNWPIGCSFGLLAVTLLILTCHSFKQFNLSHVIALHFLFEECGSTDDLERFHREFNRFEWRWRFLQRHAQVVLQFNKASGADLGKVGQLTCV